MAEESTEHPAHEGVPTQAAEEHGASHDVSQVNTTLMGLTWLTFGLLALVLYRVAWKPILAGLDARESSIRKALEDAEKARQEVQRIERERAQMLAEADAKAKSIVDTAREAAVQVAGTIESKAREEAQILIENAQREIRQESEKALAALRRESADLAINLARKVIQQDLDEAKSRKLVDQLIGKV